MYTKISKVNNVDKTSPTNENIKSKALNLQTKDVIHNEHKHRNSTCNLSKHEFRTSVAGTTKSLMFLKMFYNCPQHTSGYKIVEVYNGFKNYLTTFT